MEAVFSHREISTMGQRDFWCRSAPITITMQSLTVNISEVTYRIHSYPEGCKTMTFNLKWQKESIDLQ